MEYSKIKKHLLSVWFRIYDIVQAYHVRRKNKLSIMTSKETIAYIKEHNCSIARFGDGEFDIMLHKNGPEFQKTSDELSVALRRVFENVSEELLICIPRGFVSTKGLSREGKDYWMRWAISHQTAVVQTIRELVGDSYLFGDSYVSRPFTAYQSRRNADIIFPRLKDLWKERDILIVEGNQTRLGIGNDLFSNAKSIKRILAPAENAFDQYDKILQTILSLWNGELLILALGPTATVLASDLSKNGIQALDLGHIDIQYEWYLRGEKFQPVPGKYTNESHNGKNVVECTDAGYLSQIVASI